MSAPPVLSTNGHSSLENDVLLDSTVSVEAKATLTLLKYFDRGNGRGCFASKETLSHFVNLSPFRLKNALDELVDLGRITIQRRGLGKTDIIRIVPRSELEAVEAVEAAEPQIDSPPLSCEEIDLIEDEMAQLEEVDPEIEEEPHQVDPDESMEKIADLEVKSFDSQKPKILDRQHYREEDYKKNSFNTPCTELGTTEPQNQAPTKDQCDEKELISYFFELKENREPTKNELINWTPTAHRLLDEFTLEELLSATQYAIDQGARLFYFVALVGPNFILSRRQQREADIHREREAEKARREEEERNSRWEEKKSATVYASETENLLEALGPHMRPQILRSFFSEVFISSIDENAIILTAPSKIIAQWIEEHYSGLLREVTGKEVRIITATA